MGLKFSPLIMPEVAKKKALLTHVKEFINCMSTENSALEFLSEMPTDKQFFHSFSTA